ncbi:MAG: FRG domain-containing protein [Sandaracinaceae bacterium]|nr:FRG domain-containing protein [Sandaracinaceae bacterium]
MGRHGRGDSESLAEFFSFVETAYHGPPASYVPWKFIWRGLGNANYALHSKMYRDISDDGRVRRTEIELRTEEAKLLRTARRTWHIGQSAQGRLSDLDVLAVIQHHEGATRLIDFSHNALVGLWFAVQDPKYDGLKDSRVVVVDTSNTGAGVTRTSREVPSEWHYKSELPWSEDWGEHGRQALFWNASPIDPRMASQHGCFLFGPVPANVRAYASVPITAVNEDQLRRICGLTSVSGTHPGNIMFTVRVEMGTRAQIRQTLERSFGLTHARLFPDTHGLIKYRASVSD